MKFSIFLFLALILCVPLFGNKENYFLQKHINSENGLPQNTVRDLFFSSNGFLWIATENGLVRFDGKEIRTYNTSNSGLTRNRVSQLLPMRDGKLYCSTEGESLSIISEVNHHAHIDFVKRINQIGFSSYHLFMADSLAQFEKICSHILKENYNQPYHYSFFVLNKKKKIVQLSSKGLLIYNCKVEFEKIIPISITEISHYFISNNEFYCKTKNNKIFHINLETNTFNACSGILPNQIHTRNFPNNRNEHNLLWDYKTNRSFYIHHNDLYEISIVNNRILSTLLLRNVPEHVLNNVTLSTDDNFLVLGTINSGLFLYKRKKFEILSASESDNAIYAQAYYRKDNSIVTSMPFMQFGLNGYNKKLSDSICNNLTYYMPDDDHIWYVHGELVLNYQFSTGKTSNEITLPEAVQFGIGFFYKKDSTSVYLSTNHTLYTYSKNKELVKLGSYIHNPKVQRAYAPQIINDSLMYIATDVGVYSYHTNTNKISLSFLENINVRTIYKTKEGMILAGTYDKGYYVLENNTAIAIPLDKNENLKSTHCFIEDDFGYLWMSSNNGLYKIRKETITAYVHGKTKGPLYYYRYSHEDGLLTNEFNGGCFPNCLRLDSNRWSLPSMRGLVLFSPNDLNSKFNSNPIYIDKLLLNNIPLTTNKTSITTNSQRFQLACFVSAPNWSDDNNLYFEYQLSDSKDKSSWTMLKDNSSPIIIQNLKGGEHSLTIRKKSGEADQDYQFLTLKIIVPKKIFEYSLFWYLSIPIFLFSLWLLHRYFTNRIQRRKKHLEKLIHEKTSELHDAVLQLEDKANQLSDSKLKLEQENQLKSNLLYTLSHDIAIPLRFTNRFLGFLNKKKSEDPVSKEDLIELQISTQQLEGLLGNLVTWIKQADVEGIQPHFEPIKLYDLIEEQMQLFQLICKKKRITIENNVLKNCMIHTDKFILSRAILNVLGNAVNHSNQGNITIHYFVKSGFHEIHVSDNTTRSEFENELNQEDQLYFNQPRAGFGIGLKITQRLLGIIHGRIISTKSESGLGTLTIIYICNENL